MSFELTTTLSSIKASLDFPFQFYNSHGCVWIMVCRCKQFTNFHIPGYHDLHTLQKKTKTLFPSFVLGSFCAIELIHLYKLRVITWTFLSVTFPFFIIRSILGAILSKVLRRRVGTCPSSYLFSSSASFSAVRPVGKWRVTTVN